MRFLRAANLPTGQNAHADAAGPGRRTWPGWVVPALLLMLICSMAWRGINYVYWSSAFDSSTFRSVGWHLLQGRTLYRDIWDHKPPAIHVINAVALASGGGFPAVRLLERTFGMIAVFATFLAVYGAFNNRWLGLLTSLFMVLLLYWPPVFEGGNLTEEYGAVFLMSGIAAAVWRQRTEGRRSAVLACLAGVFFGCATLSKEPFLLAALPWIVWVGWRRHGSLGKRARHALPLLLGLALPVSAAAVWIGKGGGLHAWLQIVAYNFAYARGGEGMEEGRPFLDSFRFFYESVATASRFWLWASLAAWVALLDARKRQAERRTHVVALISGITGYFAATMGGRQFGHYWMLFIPCYLMLGASALAVFIEFAALSRRRLVLTGTGLLVLLAVLDGGVLIQHVRRLTATVPPSPRDPLVELVRKSTQAGDYIWAPQPYHTHLYQEVGRASPTRYLYVLDHLFVDSWNSSREDKLALLHRELAQAPPALMVINERRSDVLIRLGLRNWILRNYHNAHTIDGSQVWVHKTKLQDRPRQ